VPGPEPVPGRPGPRHQARERALGLLYEAEMKQRPAAEVLASLPAAPDPYAVVLVEGVDGQRPRIDALLSEAAVGWELGRMAAVDRAVLRLATYELLEQPEVPVAVVLDEAVALATEYSTDDSGRFVNGVLATIAARVRG
jgi:transcription antitermination protein NusB